MGSVLSHTNVSESCWNVLSCAVGCSSGCRSIDRILLDARGSGTEKGRFTKMGGTWQWLYDLSWSESLRSSVWAFPIIECIHIYSMVSLIGLLAAFDMRLMGFAISGHAR